jgi:hypothetical protein
MKEINLSRNKVKNFLSQQVTQQILQMNEERIFSLVRYEGIGGFGKMSDNDLFVLLVETIPEFQLLQLVRADDNQIILSIKSEYAKTEDDILVDITRIIQLKLS